MVFLLLVRIKFTEILEKCISEKAGSCIRSKTATIRLVELHKEVRTALPAYFDKKNHSALYSNPRLTELFINTCVEVAELGDKMPQQLVLLSNYPLPSHLPDQQKEKVKQQSDVSFSS